MVNKMKRGRRNRSIRIIILVTLAALLVLATDVFFVAVKQVHPNSKTDLSVYAEGSNVVKETTKAMRGNIYDRNGNIIAQDSRTYNIVCILAKDRPSVGDRPAYVKDKERTAEVLSQILNMDYQKILDFLYQDKYQTELGENGRHLTKDVRDQILSNDLPGIEFTDSIQRVYPMGTFASNLIGFAQADETGISYGRMGLELYLDEYLSGTDGSRTYQVDKKGYVLPGMKETVTPAVNGDNVTLTLDAGIQSTLEESMKETAELYKADRVWGGAMEIYSGRVIAWGQNPTFDLNKRTEITEFNNIGAQLPYEPGSTLKTFTWAAAINEGKYDGTQTAPGDKFCFTGNANNDPVRTYGANYGCIYNAHKYTYNNPSFDEGLWRSLNTIAAAIQTEVITPAIHLDYLKKFGFFKKVDTDGLPEDAGTLNFTWPAEKVTLSYGQGSTVTMLQLMQAYSAIFGKGQMVKPYFVESIRDGYDNTKVIYQAETEVTGNPITEESAKHLQSILYGVVNDERGTAKAYRIPECKLIGKTGTTQVAANGNYSSGKTITSLMIAMPAENPQVLVYYAFEADEVRSAHSYNEAARTFLRKVAMTYGFTSAEEETSQKPDSSQEPAEEVKLVTSPMPALVNHSVSYARERLEPLGADIVVLGEGPSVIEQFPKAESPIVTKQRAFLLTDVNSFTMPDMTGWTRKDVTGLWAATGFGFQLQGEGKVVSQNIPAGTVVTKGSAIIVNFE